MTAALLSMDALAVARRMVALVQLHYVLQATVPAPAGLCCRYGTCLLCLDAEHQADAQTPAELRL